MQNHKLGHLCIQFFNKATGTQRLNLFERDGMHRIQTLLQKLNDLAKTDAEKTSVIDIDLMLDYTRIL